MSKKINDGFFKTFISALSMMFKSAPVLFVSSQILNIFSGLFAALSTFATQLLFDSITFASTGKTGLPVLYALIVFGTVILIIELLKAFGRLQSYIMESKSLGFLGQRLHAAYAKTSPISFEAPAFLNRINKAEEGKDKCRGFITHFLSIFTYYIPYIASMGIYLYSVKPILVITLIIVFLPAILIHFIRSKQYAKLEDETAPLRRENGYYEGCLCGQFYFKEARLLGTFSFFKKLYMDTLILMNKKQWKTDLRSFVYSVLCTFCTLGGYVAVLIILFNLLMQGEISVGAFAAISNSISMMLGMMEGVVNEEIGEISKNYGSVRNFVSFINMKAIDKKDIPVDSNAGITVKNVSFKYPEQKELAVNNANLMIKPNETIAIVGENGAGKSTLVRLITGIYDPDEGDILYGNESIKDISRSKVFEKSSGVFQKYQRYELTLKENVLISDPENPPDEERISSSIEKAGVDKESEDFEEGYDTILSKQFGGKDLSGGQWQRIAIARGFYRNHSLIILDEPTAAIDPIEENKIFNKFAEMSKDKCALIVTHRLGSARLADRIIVMDKGNIVAEGGHEELLITCPLYATMWNAQAQWYV